MNADLKKVFAALLKCEIIADGIENNDYKEIGQGLTRVWWVDEFYDTRETPSDDACTDAEADAYSLLENTPFDDTGLDPLEAIALFIMWLSRHGIDIPEGMLAFKKKVKLGSIGRNALYLMGMYKDDIESYYNKYVED